jgi:valyl-tRNA synthetase
MFDAIAGTYIPAPGATNSVFEYRIAGVAPCVDDTSIATINVNQQPDAGTDGSTTICDSNVATIDLFSLITGEQPGGTWTRVTGSGGIFDAIAGTYTPASGVSTSVFEYRIIGVLPCVDDFSIATININPQPDAGIDGCISVSDDSAFIIDLYSLITGEQVGGTWTRTSGSGGTFDSLAATYIPAIGATTSTFSYTISGVAPCLDDSSIATIGINEQLGQAVTLFCDLANSTPNSFAFDWNNIGQTSFNFSYSIDGGPTITGNTIVSNYQIFGVTPGQSVTFTVQPVGNLCYSTTTVNCDLLSAVDFESDTVKYYPNPFNDVLNLSFSQSIESIQIFNILGQQVFDTNHRAKDFQINLSHLSSGTYLVKAISNDSTKIFKVVKY